MGAAPPSRPSLAPKPVGPPGIRGLPLIVALGALVTLIGVVLLVGSGVGYRIGLWANGVAAAMMWVGAWTCLVGALFSMLAAAMTRPGTPYRGFTLAVAAALVGLAGFGSLLYWHYASRAPLPAHTTDPATGAGGTRAFASAPPHAA